MEQGEGSNMNRKSYEQSSFEAVNDESISTWNNNGNKLRQDDDQLLGRGQDLYVPATNVNKIMTRILPPHAKISDDAKETMQECVSEFIHLITTEANKQSCNELRKTVKADDILVAMENFGFKDYIGPLNKYLDNYRKKESNWITRRGEPFMNIPARTNIYGSSTSSLQMENNPPLSIEDYSREGMNGEVYMTSMANPARRK